MTQVVEDKPVFANCPVKVAGKTGTAQESKKRPSHSIFMGFAPVDNPQMAFAIRITHGHGSANAVDAGRDIVGCFFKEQASLDKANNMQVVESSASSGD
jgi:penicillin-binding protein 2